MYSYSYYDVHYIEIDTLTSKLEQTIFIAFKPFLYDSFTLISIKSIWIIYVTTCDIISSQLGIDSVIFHLAFSTIFSILYSKIVT